MDKRKMDMLPEDESLKIAEQIAAKLLSVESRDDSVLLDKWTRADRRRVRLLEKMMERSDFDSNEELMARFPSEEGWQKISRLLDNRKIRARRLRRWIGYAAALALLAGGGIYAYMASRPSAPQPIAVAEPVEAGTCGAILTLGNGQVVDITPGGEFVISEADGTVIRKDSAGINYSQAEAGDQPMVNNQIRTLTGMEYSLVLADGTHVWLNAESSIRYPAAFKGARREVELSGEAYFEVAKDAAHPFVVTMHGVELEVVGTTFNARSYDNEEQVVATLVEGCVRVNGRHVATGQQAVYSKRDGGVVVNEVDVEQYTAWHSGNFIFRNERLEDIMKSLARWYGIEYRFVDEAAKDVRIGARFCRYDNMDPIIDMLKRTELVKVSQENRTVSISSNDNVAGETVAM